jgi:hypothetical protein
MRAAPAIALAVDMGLRSHYTVDTASSYGTGERSFTRFCDSHGLTAFPVCAVSYCGWLHVEAKRIKVSSLGMYKAGVRDASILAGHGWEMTDNELVRRTMRFLRKKYPAKSKGKKVPVTVGVLHKILPLLPGWPDMSAMSADDRAFTTASVIAVAGFLRGGEFLCSRRSSRAILMRKHMRVCRIGSKFAVVVSVEQPKARWWLAEVDVPCFENTADDTFCPVRLWREYSSRLGPGADDGPAFRIGKAALQRDYMVARTTALMRLANISFVDGKGAPMDVKAASWRSGAVCSAVRAHMPVPHMMALGRWTSDAWKNYIMQSPMDLQGSASAMWADASLQLAPPSAVLSVAEFDVVGFFSPFMVGR